MWAFFHRQPTSHSKDLKGSQECEGPVWLLPLPQLYFPSHPTQAHTSLFPPRLCPFLQEAGLHFPSWARRVSILEQNSLGSFTTCATVYSRSLITAPERCLMTEKQTRSGVAVSVLKQKGAFASACTCHGKSLRSCVSDRCLTGFRSADWGHQSAPAPVPAVWPLDQPAPGSPPHAS